MFTEYTVPMHCNKQFKISVYKLLVYSINVCVYSVGLWIQELLITEELKHSFIQFISEHQLRVVQRGESRVVCSKQEKNDLSNHNVYCFYSSL